MLLPPSADRRVVDLQLGGLEPAVEVRSSLGRARLALDTFASRNQKEKCGHQERSFQLIHTQTRRTPVRAASQLSSQLAYTHQWRRHEKNARETRAK